MLKDLLQYNITTSTYYRILRSGTTNLQPDQKRAQKAKYNQVNETVHEIMITLRQQGIPVSRPAIKLLAARARRQF